MLPQADTRWIELDSVASTNSYLSQAYVSGLCRGNAVVFAHEQTAGRGRQGRAWQAEKGCSVCFSIGLSLRASQLPVLPLVVGVQLAGAFRRQGVPVDLKWPNDLLLEGKKLGGVLCETVSCGPQAYMIVGIGINFSRIEQAGVLGGVGTADLGVADLSAWLSPNPGFPISPLQWARYLVPNVLQGVHDALQKGFAHFQLLFNELDAWFGQTVQVQDAGKILCSGKSLGVAEQGAYLIETSTGLQTITAGDVSLRCVK